MEQNSGQITRWESDVIAVCSGLHVKPNIPKIESLETVPEVIHSTQFKGRKQFGEDKTIMVVESGETGAGVSSLAVTSPTRRIVLCHHNGFHFAPEVRSPEKNNWKANSLHSINQRDTLTQSYFRYLEEGMTPENLEFQSM